MNNDIELLSNNWDEIIIKKFEEYHFGALGPDIVSPDFKNHENPTSIQDVSISGLKNMIRDKKFKYLLYSTYIIPISEKLKSVIKKTIGLKAEFNDII